MPVLTIEKIIIPTDLIGQNSLSPYALDAIHKQEHDIYKREHNCVKYHATHKSIWLLKKIHSETIGTIILIVCQNIYNAGTIHNRKQGIKNRIQSERISNTQNYMTQ